MKPEELLEQVIAIASDAGKMIRGIYQQGSFQQNIKDDLTPVTSADIAAHELITQRLSQLTPDIPVLSEEASDIPLAERGHWSSYWLVDPLDGTGEFIAGSGDFSVIIALVQQHRPVLGVVYVPMSEKCYYAVVGHGAFIRHHGVAQRIHSRQPAPAQHLRLAISRRQDPAKVLRLFREPEHCELLPLGGAALKSCMVAEGRADCYVRVGPTGEWDTGAAQIIIEEAGGRLLDTSLQPLTYNERDTLENPNFIVMGAPELAWEHILKAV
ncbi:MULTISPECIES: 3'(2'),5'-bisphosphate nucleotidase CysQ [Shewanella]|jgi:3'(2'), 5'-bisphosphate nucleotidase|uniref:3'(2'),5'-bisphosphate nucleotidase CysQ n=1 Tax=Shewanella fodinae TaxID=552357 RepID=A0A4R2F260_9GAMM|nr:MULTISPECIES: 3'(2'),5'-bisphosphate nucleotidase CysQ [Shewanella]MDN5368925.1 3(2), 5-bisphosphate nucleotidase [Shewanella sp.]MBO1272743.1 3'(2'),5'-bisphosphate nucleotidase CysQ [Shewanella sp. 4t3-1-2LB]MCL2906769.1 3'(2'),5'-bisphosphate nucleotidase CysQ [Shewanella fodinae]TCN79344.1 3'(2'),5'-bisphosphate nucleotidase [Shewanella fodinae]GGZ02542.1 3'(2'),5'-bisphosphate nucleotidase CysQ [Shewanella fodinae]